MMSSGFDSFDMLGIEKPSWMTSEDPSQSSRTLGTEGAWWNTGAKKESKYRR